MFYTGGEYTVHELIGATRKLMTAAFLTQTVKLDDATNIKFEIWDTVSRRKLGSN